MSIVPIEDINYLAQQSSENINIIISGMAALIKDTDHKVKAMESQNWFQRMIKTVTGKNKLTKKEIQRNHDKLCAYMTKAIAELYNQGCIERKVMMSLGTQLNELYVDHLQLKSQLGAFVKKLDEKINSIDNFHMLIEEIVLDVYSNNARIVAMCQVISQFDKRILEDRRKQEIIRRSLIDRKIINDDNISLKTLLMEIIEIPRTELGQIYMELNTIRGNATANIILDMMERYHFLSETERNDKDNKKGKKQLIKEEIEQGGLYDAISWTYSDIYDGFIRSKIAVKDKLYAIKQGSPYLESDQDWGTTSEDIEMVKEWRLKAADKGNGYAATQMGIIALENNNYTEAVKYFKKAAENGYAEAQNRLAFRYCNGQGIEKNMQEAFKWYLKAAEQGHMQAMYNTGLCYHHGSGTAIDHQKAQEFLRKSAELGYDAAEEKLSMWYR